MFKRIATSLLRKARHIAPRVAPQVELSARQLNFYGRGKGGKVSHKRGNAAQLKRASLKRNNIRKHS